MPNETLDATTPPTRVLRNRCPPGRAASRISITTITVLENSPPYAPVKPTRVFTWESSSPSALRRANQVPAPPPMAPRAFSGPRLAPPISDTAETAAIPGTIPGSTCPLLRSSNRPGTCSGRRVRRRSNPTTTPAAAVIATHHQCPPNQPGSESRVPLASEVDHAHEDQTRECAEHPESDRVSHQHPELPLLTDRYLGSRLGRGAHDADLLTAALAHSAIASNSLQPRHRLDRAT